MRLLGTNITTGVRFRGVQKGLTWMMYRNLSNISTRSPIRRSASGPRQKMHSVRGEEGNVQRRLDGFSLEDLGGVSSYRAERAPPNFVPCSSFCIHRSPLRPSHPRQDRSCPRRKRATTPANFRTLHRHRDSHRCSCIRIDACTFSSSFSHLWDERFRRCLLFTWSRILFDARWSFWIVITRWG